MTHDQILELLDRRVEAFDRRDLKALERLYAKDAVSESPLGGSATGPEAIVKILEAFFVAFPDTTFTYEPPVIEGDRVAFIGTISGTHIGDFMNLPPSGKPFRFASAFFVRVHGGQIVHERRIYDFTGLLVQIGVLKAKPA